MMGIAKKAALVAITILSYVKSKVNLYLYCYALFAPFENRNHLCKECLAAEHEDRYAEEIVY